MDTADRYREAGMPAPREEVYIPTSGSREAAAALLADVARAHGHPVELAPGGSATNPPLVERVHDPDSKEPDTTDADTEEKS